MRQPASQPWQTFPFWFLVFAGVGLTAAWKLNLLPGNRPSPDGVASFDEGDEVDLSETPAGRAASH